jgi:hypothetical protein
MIYLLADTTTSEGTDRSLFRYDVHPVQNITIGIINVIVVILVFILIRKRVYLTTWRSAAALKLRSSNHPG